VFGTSHCRMLVQKRATQSQNSVKTYYRCVQEIPRTGWNLTWVPTVQLLQIFAEILCFLTIHDLSRSIIVILLFFEYSLISKFTALPFLNLLTYKQTFLFRFLGIFVLLLKNSTFLDITIR
jgi:hypothetical protein